MSILRQELENEKNNIRNSFTGTAFTYSYNNELKAAMDRRRKEKTKKNLNRLFRK